MTRLDDNPYAKLTLPRKIHGASTVGELAERGCPICGGKLYYEAGERGPYGKKTKRRVIPMTDRVRRVSEHHFAFGNTFGMLARTIQRIVKRVANNASIAKPVSPHVLRHTFSVTCIKKGISTRALIAAPGA